MASQSILIPDDLLRLKPSEALESVSLSTLARRGTAVLQQMTSTAQAVAVKVQGQAAMVTISQRQYDEMLALIHQLQEEQEDDGFARALSRRFDDLAAQMSEPGAASATDDALFGDPDALARAYRPGATESGS